MKQGWTYKTLGQVCKMYQPHTISSKEMVEDGAYDVFGANGIIGKYNQYNHEFPEILMTCRGATCGNINISTPKSWINGNAMVIHIEDESVINRSFLVYLLSFVDKSHIITGAAQPQITRQTLSPLVICFPSLPEQERIVEQLDAAFAQIDELKNNAERQLAEARALFQSALTQAMQPKQGWQEKKLGDISIISGDYGLSVPSKPFDGIRYLRITDITEWGNLNDEKVSADFDGEITKEKLEEGDVLFARTGATVGKTLVYRESFGDCLYAGYLIRYRINKKEVLPQFLHYFTHSKDYFDWVLLNQKAAAQPNINAKKYNGLVIKFPSIAEQQTVINYLDSLFSKLHELEGINQEIVAECDALKQALLRQIFE